MSEKWDQEKAPGDLLEAEANSFIAQERKTKKRSHDRLGSGQRGDLESPPVRVCTSPSSNTEQQPIKDGDVTPEQLGSKFEDTEKALCTAYTLEQQRLLEVGKEISGQQPGNHVARTNHGQVEPLCKQGCSDEQKEQQDQQPATQRETSAGTLKSYCCGESNRSVMSGLLKSPFILEATRVNQQQSQQTSQKVAMDLIKRATYCEELRPFHLYKGIACSKPRSRKSSNPKDDVPLNCRNALGEKGCVCILFFVDKEEYHADKANPEFLIANTNKISVVGCACVVVRNTSDDTLGAIMIEVGSTFDAHEGSYTCLGVAFSDVACGPQTRADRKKICVVAAPATGGAAEFVMLQNVNFESIKSGNGVVPEVQDWKDELEKWWDTRHRASVTTADSVASKDVSPVCAECKKKDQLLKKKDELMKKKTSDLTTTFNARIANQIKTIDNLKAKMAAQKKKIAKLHQADVKKQRNRATEAKNQSVEGIQVLTLNAQLTQQNAQLKERVEELKQERDEHLRELMRDKDKGFELATTAITNGKWLK